MTLVGWIDTTEVLVDALTDCPEKNILLNETGIQNQSPQQIVALYVNFEFSGYLKSFSKLLQGSHNDIMSALDNIRTYILEQCVAWRCTVMTVVRWFTV